MEDVPWENEVCRGRMRNVTINSGKMCNGRKVESEEREERRTLV